MVLVLTGTVSWAPAAAAPGKPSWKTVDRVVAVVNDEIVMLSEWDEAYDAVLKTMPPGESRDPGKMTELRQRLLENLIRDRLVSQEADKQKVTVKDEQVESAVKDLRDRNFGGNAVAFEQALRQEHLLLDDLKDRLRSQLKQQVLVQKEVQSKIAVSDAEVEEYFKAHAPELAEPEERRARHILFAVPERAKPSEAAKVEARARATRLEIAGGASFEDKAKEISDDAATKERGGDLGWIKKGELVSALEDALFSLKPGEFSAVLRAPTGYEILKLDEVKGGKARGLNEKTSVDGRDVTVREVVKARLQDVRYRDAFEEWTKRLRGGATVILKD